MDNFYNYYYDFYSEFKQIHDFRLPTKKEFRSLISTFNESDLLSRLKISNVNPQINDFDSFDREYVKWFWLAKLSNTKITHKDVIGLMADPFYEFEFGEIKKED